MVKKKTKKSAAKEFNPAFSFEDNFADTGFAYDPLQYAKKKRATATTLDEKIVKARTERKKKSQVSHSRLNTFLISCATGINLWQQLIQLRIKE